MNAATLFLLALSLVSSLVYLFREGGAPYPARPTMKAGGVGPIAILAFLFAFAAPAAIAAPAFCLAIGLLLCTVGDVFLAVPDEERNFPRGLAAFLAAHFFFVAAFAPFVPLEMPSAPRLVAVAALAILAWGMFRALKPGLGPLVVPVGAYFGVIGAMAAAAILGDFGGPTVAIGAVTFLVSDAVIAVDKFRARVPAGPWLIWATYYVAILLIALGMLRFLAGMARAPVTG